MPHQTDLDEPAGVHPTWKWLAITLTGIIILGGGSWGGWVTLTLREHSSTLAERGERITRWEERLLAGDQREALRVETIQATFQALKSDLGELKVQIAALARSIDEHRRNGR